MPCQQVPAVADALDDRRPFACRYRLHNDLSFIPAIVIFTFRQREKDRLAARQHLGSVHIAIAFERDNALRCTSVRCYSKNARISSSASSTCKHNTFWTPVDAGGPHYCANAYRSTPIRGDSHDAAVCQRKIRDRSTIG